MSRHAHEFAAVDIDGVPRPGRNWRKKKKHHRPAPSSGISHKGRTDTADEHAATHQQADLSDPETNLGLPPFEDPRVFAVPHTYGAPCFGPNDFVARRLENGPAFIVVGAEIDDARMLDHLPELRERYGVTLEQLQAARSGETVCVRTEAP